VGSHGRHVNYDEVFAWGTVIVGPTVLEVCWSAIMHCGCGVGGILSSFGNHCFP